MHSNTLSTRSKRTVSCAVFTRIELLTLVAILAILAAILGPAMQKQGSIAKRQQCAAKIRAWANAFILYSYEHHGRAAVKSNTTYWYMVGTNNAIYRNYFTPPTNQAYQMESLGSMENCPAEDNKNVIYRQNSFMRNCYMPVIPWDSASKSDFIESNGRDYLIPLEKIRNPSQCLLFVERSFKTDGSPWSSNGYDVYLRRVDIPNWQKNFQFFKRHNISQDLSLRGSESGPSNVAWCDGHVSTVYWSHENEADSLSARVDNLFNFQRWTKAD